MDILEWLQKQGYNTQAHESMLPYIKLWRGWHKGKVDSFHDYKVWNGHKSVSQTKHGLGMAKQVSETYADLLLNEKVEYSVGDEQQSQVFNDKFVSQVDFQKVANEGVELVMALGTGALVLSFKDAYIDAQETVTLDESSKFNLDFVTADKIIPLTYSKKDVTEVAFVTNTVIDNKEITYVNIHKLEDEGYVVYNHYFELDERNNLKEIELEGVLSEFHTHSYRPLFTIMRPNTVNTIDVDSPFGISVYHHAIDILKGIDNAYDSFVNEFSLGRKRLFISSEALKVDENTLEPRFDTNDLTFHVLEGGYSDTGAGEPKKLITESNMVLRINEHKEGIQLLLNLLSESVGLGDGYYSFEKGGVKTATEVISDNSSLYRSIKKQELGLQNGLIRLFKSALEIGQDIIQLPEDLPVTLDFDDSIIEDTEAIFQRALLLRNAGVIDDVEFFIMTDKLTEEQAIQKVDNILNRKELDVDIEEE